MPFNGHPQGMSAVALELLDKGLNQIWHEMQVASDAKASAAPPQLAAGSSAPARIQDQGRRETLPLDAQALAIAK